LSEWFFFGERSLENRVAVPLGRLYGYLFDIATKKPKRAQNKKESVRKIRFAATVEDMTLLALEIN